MHRLWLYPLIVVVSVTGFLILEEASAGGSIWPSVAVGLAVAFLVPTVEAVVDHRRYFKYLAYAVPRMLARRRVRVSASYLYRIRVDDEYLLIQGRRWSQWQPVGGVYKVTPGGSAKMQELNVLRDDLIAFDDVSDRDLRVRVPAKQLVPFMRWFDQGGQREIGPWREFYEELVAPGHLSRDNFPFVQVEWLGRHEETRYSHQAQSFELLIADVYELLPTDEQSAELRHLRAQDVDGLLWITEAAIRRRGATDGSTAGQPVGRHAGWLFDL